jgi:hypothetical protein
VDAVIELAGYYSDAAYVPPVASSEPVTGRKLELNPEAWRDGFPAGEVLPGREIRQRFRCPVVALQDLAVVFATYGRTNRGTVVIELSANGEPLGSTRIDAAAIPPNGWVPLVPQRPVSDCGGRDLMITIRSDDAVPGSGVTVWTYPRYYEGEFIQRDAPGLRDRSLGLLINRGPRK